MHGADAAPTVATKATAKPAAASYKDGRYIATFAEDAVASYDGSVSGFAATRPKAGHKLDRNAAAVKAWQRHLEGRHDSALAQVGATKIYDYSVATNGVAAYLTAGQAAKLAKVPGVVRLTPDQRVQTDTTLSPHFLGLDAQGGLWSELGGAKNAGAGVVVGVVDSGIWPESEAF
jgi:hypothetical protein